MEIIRNIDGNLYIKDGKKMVMKAYVKSGNLTFSLSKNHPIVVSQNDDMYLYKNLKKIINSKYTFDDSGFSYQVDNKVIFMSDEYKYNKGVMNRINLEDLGESIKISAGNATNNNENVKVYFFSNGGGAYSVNNKTNSTFQKDMVEAYYKTLQNQIFNGNSKSKTYSYI